MSERRTNSRAVVLTSPKNPLLRDVRRAIDRGALTAEGMCIAESFHLLEEALRSQCSVPTVLAAESVASTVERKLSGLRNTSVLRLAEPVFRSVSATETSQGVIALVQPPRWDLDAIFRGLPLVVVLDGVQDPGNCGTILRAAEAFGASGAMLLKGTVNPYNSKAVRASAGSVFRLPLISGIEAQLAVAAARQRRTELYAAMPRSSSSVAEVDLKRRCALVIGSEGHGVSAQLIRASTGVSIPTTGVESLNAALAAGILLYEAARQRRFTE